MKTGKSGDRSESHLCIRIENGACIRLKVYTIPLGCAASRFKFRGLILYENTSLDELDIILPHYVIFTGAKMESVFLLPCTVALSSLLVV